MSISLEENTEVITSDGKKIGKVKRIENEGYFIVSKKGLLTDEEIRIPVTAIVSRKGGSADNEPIRLNMSEETLKHGFEYMQAEPNSEFMHGKQESEPKVSLQKQVIRFEPIVDTEEANKTGISSPPVSKQHEAVLKTGEAGTMSHFSCDMCLEKFDKSEELQRHRGESHKAPVNI
jgi:hypothetical protein